MGIAIGHILDGKYIHFCFLFADKCKYLYVGKIPNKSTFTLVKILILGTVLAYTSTAIPSIEQDNITFSSKDDNLKPFLCKYYEVRL